MIYIGLARAINVGGHQPVSMAQLRELFDALHFGNPRTLLQSGNVLFDAERQSTAHLERQIETEAAKRLGLQADFFVRTAAEWSELIAGNPFPAEAKRDPARFVLMVLRDAPGVASIEAVRAANAGPETFRIIGKSAYIIYPNGQGRSRFTAALIEKKLGTRGTARNWNTVTKLAALADAR